jgi:hypothetical protein
VKPLYTFLLFSLSILTILYWSKGERREVVKEEVSTEKKPRNISSYPTQDENFPQLNKIHVGILPKAPPPRPLLPKKSDLVKEKNVFEGRKIESKKKDKEWNENNLDFANEFNPDWEELLTDRLMIGMDPHMKLKIQKQKSFIKIISGRAFYVEQVAVKFTQSNGRVNSFTALINSENGKVISSWDKTIHETLNREEVGVPPSGTL